MSAVPKGFAKSKVMRDGQEFMVTNTSTKSSSTGDDSAIDTLGTSVENFLKVMLDLAKDVRTKADLLFRDLIEPADLYCKHYTATNSILID